MCLDDLNKAEIKKVNQFFVDYLKALDSFVKSYPTGTVDLLDKLDDQKRSVIERLLKSKISSKIYIPCKICLVQPNCQIKNSLRYILKYFKKEHGFRRNFPQEYINLIDCPAVTKSFCVGKIKQLQDEYHREKDNEHTRDEIISFIELLITYLWFEGKNKIIDDYRSLF